MQTQRSLQHPPNEEAPPSARRGERYVLRTGQQLADTLQEGLVRVSGPKDRGRDPDRDPRLWDGTHMARKVLGKVSADRAAGALPQGAPVDDGPAAPASRPGPRIRRSSAGKPRSAPRAPVAEIAPAVVVATADPSLARMLTFALEQIRLPHRMFASGTVLLRELLVMPVTGQPPIVVLDVDLPGVDGHAILERVGLQRPNTFLIVVLSSHADESVQVRSLLAGAVDHLAKPFNVRVLMAKLQRWSAMASRVGSASTC